MKTCKTLNSFRRSNTQNNRATIAEVFYNLDLEKDFFSLEDGELARLEVFRRVCNFQGKNNQGRSSLRQFYYHLQHAMHGLPF